MFGIARVDSDNCDGVCDYMVKTDDGSFIKINKIKMSKDFENYSLLEFKDDIKINEYPLPSLKEYKIKSILVFVDKNIGGENYLNLYKELSNNQKIFLRGEK